MSDLSQTIRNRVTGMRVIPASELQGRDGNWRLHPKFQRDSLRGLLESIGIAGALTAFHSEVQGGLTLIDGHLRKEDYPDTGWPTLILDVNDAEADVLLATLGPIAALAEAESDALDALLKTVETESEAVKALLERLAADEGIDLGGEPVADPGAQVSRADELQEKWQVETGDLWEIGAHRLICGDCTDGAVVERVMGGDCTDGAVVERVMGGERTALLFTSPPYWVGKKYETQKSEREIDAFILACVKAWTDSVRVDAGRIVINTGTAAIHRIDKKRKVEVLPLIGKWQEAMRQRGWLIRHIRIWAKSGDLPASISPKTDVVDQRWEHLITFEHSDWDYVITLWSPAGQQRGQEKIGTTWAQQGVWRYQSIWSDIQGDKSAGGMGHIAAFPVELPSRNLQLYTQRGEAVLDPFLGSGTTAVACEQLHRRCFGIEIHPPYVSVCLERLSGLGLEPRRVE